MSESAHQYKGRGAPGHCRLCGAKHPVSLRCDVCTWVGHEDFETELSPRPENENVREDDAFRIVLRFGTDAFKEFRAANSEERAEMLRLTSRSSWPKNEHGNYACCCCGYFTLAFAPGSNGICQVCLWQDNGIDWNMYWWDTGNGVSVEQGRVNFEEHGCARGGAKSVSRPPRPDEHPRHDWASDDRPYWQDPQKKAVAN